MKTRKPKEPNQRAGRASPSQCVHVEFHDGQAQQVSLAGTFNEWRPNATPMIALGHGRWVKELMLPSGRYQYQLVVDGRWRSDPAAVKQVSNPFGGFNSVLEVRDSHEPARPQTRPKTNASFKIVQPLPMLRDDLRLETEAKVPADLLELRDQTAIIEWTNIQQPRIV